MTRVKGICEIKYRQSHLVYQRKGKDVNVLKLDPNDLVHQGL